MCSNRIYEVFRQAEHERHSIGKGKAMDQIFSIEIGRANGQTLQVGTTDTAEDARTMARAMRLAFPRADQVSAIAPSGVKLVTLWRRV